MTDFFIEGSSEVFGPGWGVVRPELTPEHLATLDLFLPREPRLLVPVDVQALVVGPRGVGVRGDVRSRVLDEDPGERLPDPFTDADDLPAGVHLHWAVPDGLTAATPPDPDDPAVADGDLGMRPLPNRWVVVRIARTTGTRRRPVRAWVVESERGEAFDLAAWRSDRQRSGRALDPSELTAVAGGDLGWAAIYDNVRNRFGFHDPLDDLTTAADRRGPHTYVVAGWYSRPDLDPLHPAATPTGLRAALDELGWQVDDAEFDRLAATLRERMDEVKLVAHDATVDIEGIGEVPVTVRDAMLGVGDLQLRDGITVVKPTRPTRARQSLYHGTIYGVRGDGGGPDPRPRATATAIAVGPTSTDSLSRMVASGASAAAREEHERLLAAFGHGVIEEYTSLDGLSEVDTAIHRDAFRSRDGGSTTDTVRTAQPVMPDTIPSTASSTVAAKSGYSIGESKHGEVMFSFTDERFPTFVANFGLAPELRDLSGARVPLPAFTTVTRPLPRFHLAVDPVLTIRGLNRSLRHGYDGRFEADERLECRVSGQWTRGFGALISGSQLVAEITHGGIPVEVSDLVREAALFDPEYTWHTAGVVPHHSGLSTAQVRARIEAEVVLDKHLHARAADAGRLLGTSMRDGSPVSPVGITYWHQPWVPRYVEWDLVASLTQRPGPQWTLGELDLEPGGELPELTDLALTGRSLLASSGAKVFSDAIDRFLVEENRLDETGTGALDAADQAALTALASDVRWADLLTGTLDGLTDHLLGFDTDVEYSPAGEPHGDPKPARLPQLVRAGLLQLKRVRVVDAFGRTLDLSDQIPLTQVADPLVDPRADDRGGRPSTRTDQAPIHLAPRLTSPARLQFRFVDASDERRDAFIDESTPLLDGNPVAGWLLPDHADDALEFFDATGAPMGQLFHRSHRREVTWEKAPGREEAAGTGPPASPPGGPTLGKVAAALTERDAIERSLPDDDPDETPLAALLRAIDTTMWTTDPFGATGVEHLSELVGRPIAVVRARIRLDLYDDSDDYGLDAAAVAARRARFREQADRAFQIRLGSLTRFDDGLIGYYVGDDFSLFHPVDAAVRAAAPEGGAHRGFLADVESAHEFAGTLTRRAITQNYVTDADLLDLRPSIEVKLTLLMQPGLGVHATSGLLPRKKLELNRAWITEPLARIVPSFRFGPVLVDPTTVRLPRVSALPTGQGWASRDTPTSWRDDPIVAATSTARLPDRPAIAREGWVHARSADEEST